MMRHIENIGIVAYIASPVHIYIRNAKTYDDYVFGLENARSHATAVAIKAKEMGYIPVSAPMTFLSVYDERTEREIALEACFSVLKKCDVFFYDTRDLHKSEGMRKELEFAQKNGLTIVAI